MRLKKDKGIFKSIISSHLNNLCFKNIAYVLSHISQKKDKKERSNQEQK